MNNPANAPLAIIQLGAPPAAIIAGVGEQHNWFIRALGLAPGDYLLIRPDLGDPLPDDGAISGAILTGSWAMVTDGAAWSEATATWIREVYQRALPLLGVCYGHQLMAYALGGAVADNPQGWEGGLQWIEATRDAGKDLLLAGLPGRFSAWLSHRQTVLSPPAGARVLAASQQDHCQVIRYSPQAFSVQFHPEFTAAIMDACLRANGRVPEQEAPRVGTSGDGAWPLLILRRFYPQRRREKTDGAAA
ncbi:glutamine amidotransferase [Acerihabitans arboris]|uniref:Glutamine amidotransferase n=1 Tax=Acerihabitans arboris TaxID=2691583 RepID=A0A845SLI8_9GAMM|nr:glutamine amidotransferase [Acerihabitans arboris]NDL63856.1 glutamine amidotransferase [Acerihabitans arboris]